MSVSDCQPSKCWGFCESREMALVSMTPLCPVQQIGVRYSGNDFPPPCSSSAPPPPLLPSGQSKRAPGWHSACLSTSPLSHGPHPSSGGSWHTAPGTVRPGELQALPGAQRHWQGMAHAAAGSVIPGTPGIGLLWMLLPQALFSAMTWGLGRKLLTCC